MDIGLLAAFVGGILALLSPCSALLLPAFFAATVGARGRLALHGLLFYAGLLTTLVPVGIGVGAVAGAFARHRTSMIAVASLVIIALGVVQLFGRGFDLSRAVPGVEQLQQQSVRRVGLVKTLLLGAVSGVAGFCTGPILGAVLTMAATRGVAGATVLLCVYAAGMVVPLMLIAALWNRLGDGTRRLLRGRELGIGRVRIHTTNLVTGILLIVVGTLFWLTDGFVGTPEPVGTDVQARLQNGVSLLADPVVDVAAIIAVTAGVIAWWWRSSKPAAPSDSTDPSESADP